jgi:hypothetical protein
VSEARKGDLVRVRALGTDDEWCVCRVDLDSPNGQALMLVPLEDNALRLSGGILMGAIAVVVRNGGAFELMSKTELEMEKYAERT